MILRGKMVAEICGLSGWQMFFRENVILNFECANVQDKFLWGPQNGQLLAISV